MVVLTRSAGASLVSTYTLPGAVVTATPRTGVPQSQLSNWNSISTAHLQPARSSSRSAESPGQRAPLLKSLSRSTVSPFIRRCDDLGLPDLVRHVLRPLPLVWRAASVDPNPDTDVTCEEAISPTRRAAAASNACPSRSSGGTGRPSSS